MAYDKTNTTHMKEYLRHVITFERKVYIWSNALHTAGSQVSKLTDRQASVERELRSTEQELRTLDQNASDSVAYKREEIERCKRLIKKKRRPKIIFVCVLLLLWLALAVALGIKVGGKGVVLSTLCLIPIAIPAWAFHKIGNSHAEIEDAQETIAQYTQELNSGTNQNQARRQKMILADNADQLRSAKQATANQLSVAASNKNEIATALKKAEQTLRDIYALNMLPQKYRTLNAAATLYEYLDTGRCTVIQGHGGIYDTYEYDLKLGLIIAKLDDIIDRLDAIEMQQRMLYAELKTANASLSSINKELCSFHDSFNRYAATALEYQQQEAATVQWMAWNQWHNS